MGSEEQIAAEECDQSRPVMFGFDPIQNYMQRGAWQIKERFQDREFTVISCHCGASYAAEELRPQGAANVVRDLLADVRSMSLCCLLQGLIFEARRVQPEAAPILLPWEVGRRE